jgi:hypothetical protein
MSDETLEDHQSEAARQVADEKVAQELVALLGEIHPAHIPPTPAVLYHYTTAAGLLGIVSSRYFRGTNYSFMNDASEFKYGVDMTLKRFEAEARNRDKNDPISLIAGVAGEIWMERQASLAQSYVACFTEARDDLAQWRGYGGSADRYCLGIDAVKLSQRATYSFAPVIYVRAEQEALLEEYFEAALNFLRARQPFSEALVLTATKILCGWLLVSMPFFKDSHFASEREWRAVTNIHGGKSEELSFEPSSGTLRPYMRLYESELNLPITEVIVQSGRRDERAAKAVSLLLQRYGYEETEVVESEVPFRAV